MTMTARGSAPAYVVLLGRFMTNIGFFMVIPFLTIFVTQDAGMSSLQAGALFAVLEFTRRGLGIPAGWASDRFGAARMLTIGLLIEVFAYLAFVVAGRSFLFWIAAVALLGLGGSLNNNGARSLLATVNTGSAAINLSRYYVSINGAALIGPLIGTALLATGSAEAGFVVTAVLHLGFAVVSAILLRGVDQRIGTSAIRAADMGTALRDSHLMTYCALAVGGWFLITHYRIAMPLTIVDQQLPNSLVGLLTAANAALVMVTMVVIGKRLDKRGTLGHLDIFAMSSVVLGGGWLLCAFTGITPLAASVIVTTIGESMFCGVIDATVAGLAPVGRTGLYLGYSTMAWGVGGVLAGFSGGAFDLAKQHGALVLFWSGLALVGVLSAIGVRLARNWLAAAVEDRQAQVAVGS